MGQFLGAAPIADLNGLPPNETSAPVFQLRPFVAETSFETSVNNDLDLGDSTTCSPNGELMESPSDTQVPISQFVETVQLWGGNVFIPPPSLKLTNV